MLVQTFCVACAALLMGSQLSLAADVSSSKDLLATIVLNGQSCDQVVNSKRNGDSDYVATCKNGSRYHVFVNDKGRVVVEKL